MVSWHKNADILQIAVQIFTNLHISVLACDDLIRGTPKLLSKNVVQAKLEKKAFWAQIATITLMRTNPLSLCSNTLLLFWPEEKFFKAQRKRIFVFGSCSFKLCFILKGFSMQEVFFSANHPQKINCDLD